MKRILIVDDNLPTLRMMEDVTRSLIEELEKGIVEILTATSGQEALQILRADHVDLLITDYSMPEMSGIELIRLLGSNIGLKKVLLSFEFLQIKDRVNMIYAGVDEVLSKPVDKIRLEEILNKYL